MNPGGGSGWDEPPLDIQVPDDARELDRDVLAYHREQRAQRRRHRLRRLTSPFGGQGTVMPLLASILAVCLVAGAMLSVATFSPGTGSAKPVHHPSATAASGLRSASQRSSAQSSSTQNSATGTSSTGTSSTGTSSTGTSSTGTSSTGTSATARPPAGGSGTARPSDSANSSARSVPSASPAEPPRLPGAP